jgi:hypothetical protein
VKANMKVAAIVPERSICGLVLRARGQARARWSAVASATASAMGANGERYDADLRLVGLTGSGQAVKVRGLRRALAQVLQNVPGLRWVKKVFDWGNSLSGAWEVFPASVLWQIRSGS